MHRFYVASEIEISDNLEIVDKDLLWQWNKVLRFKPGNELVLFNGNFIDYNFTISHIDPKKAQLILINKNNITKSHYQRYLFWSLLKRDNNELIIQKATELGIDHFVPIISDRTIKKDFNYERAKKIAIEASEQCGRGDIPILHPVIKLADAVGIYKDSVLLYVGNMDYKNQNLKQQSDSGFFIGPEGGWTDSELDLFSHNKVSGINLGNNILRAETAAIIASAKLAQIC